MLEHYVPLPVGGIYYNLIPPSLIPDNACQMALNMDFKTNKGFITRDGVGEVARLSNNVTFLGGFTKFNGQTKVVAGSSSTLYSINPSSGAVSSLGSFPNSYSNPISYTNFTDKLLLVNRSNKLKTWDGVGSTLTEVADSQPAKHVRSFGAYVLLLHPVDSGNEVPQRIRWSVPGDLNDWTGPGSGFLDLVDTPDPIMNGLMYGSSFIVYKRNSVIILDIVGSGASTFRVTSSYTKAGMISSRGLVDLGDSHVFLGHDNFYRFTGSPHLEPIGDPIWQLVQEKGDWNKMEQAHAVHDVYNHKAVFYIPLVHGWGVFNYDYKLEIWSYYEYPFDPLCSFYSIEYGNYLTSGNIICKTSGSYLTDLGSTINSEWVSKKFILEGDVPQSEKFKRFLGVEIELEGGNIFGSIKYGNEAGDNLNFPSRTFSMLSDGDTHIYKVDFDVSGKFAVIKIKSSGSNSRLSVRGFKLKYEMGGV